MGFFDAVGDIFGGVSDVVGDIGGGIGKIFDWGSENKSILTPLVGGGLGYLNMQNQKDVQNAQLDALRAENERKYQNDLLKAQAANSRRGGGGGGGAKISPQALAAQQALFKPFADSALATLPQMQALYLDALNTLKGAQAKAASEENLARAFDTSPVSAQNQSVKLPARFFK